MKILFNINHFYKNHWDFKLGIEYINAPSDSFAFGFKSLVVLLGVVKVEFIWREGQYEN